jgi:hypothetical protein
VSTEAGQLQLQLHDHVVETLDLALKLTDDIQAAYLQADTTERRLLNQAFFERIEIDDEDITGHTLNQPFNTVAKLATAHRSNGNDAANRGGNAQTPDPLKKVRGSYVSDVVEPTGFEPVTFWLPAKRSPS